MYVRNNLPVCINPKEIDAELIMQGLFEDIFKSKDPALAMFQSPTKEIPSVAPAGPGVFQAPVASTASESAIADARTLLASLPPPSAEASSASIPPPAAGQIHYAFGVKCTNKVHFGLLK